MDDLVGLEHEVNIDALLRGQADGIDPSSSGYDGGDERGDIESDVTTIRLRIMAP